MLCMKKPIFIRKLLLLVLAIALLIPVLAACQSQQAVPDKSSYEPLSEEKIKEIRAAWETAQDPPLGNRDYHYLLDFTSGENYYGTHGDCIALFYMWPETDLGIVGTILVDDLLFHSPLPAKLIIYRNGEFAEIHDAYAKGWITYEQIISMQEHHKTTTNASGGPDKWHNGGN